jgi:2-phosphosulfolactate phosphatase
VIVDVLRFTTSAAYALANGARSIIPCASIEDARLLAHRTRDDAAQPLAEGACLLAGERHAVKPDGFDLGNSPFEFTREAVQDRDIAWTTTNGTRAIAIATGLSPIGAGNGEGASGILPLVPQPVPRSRASIPSPFRDLVLLSYVNLSAVVACLAPRLEARSAVAIACSGRDGGFALEDAACAGALVRRLQAAVGDRLTMDDGARACACLDEAYGEDFARLFRDAQHGRFLGNHGFGADLRACAALDAVPVVPCWRDGRFVAG